jgi:antirestriction protein ArdC
MQTKDIMQKVADQVIKNIDKHDDNWLKSWVSSGMAKNIRGTYYKGMNTVILWCVQQEFGYTSQTYATFNQIKAKGGKVKKGEKGHQVIYMQPSLFRKARDNETADQDGSVKVQYNLMRSYCVFNLDQTNLEDQDIEAEGSDTLPKVEKYIENTKADIRHDNDLFAGKCYYVPSKDYIGMVQKDKFKSINGSTATENYYSTILHELTHWTGHESRCDRKEKYKAKYFDNIDKYAFEELVAEMGSAIQTCMLGITLVPAKHACQYLNIWKSRIKEDPSVMFKASAYAQAGVNHILELQKEKSVKKVA